MAVETVSVSLRVWDPSGPDVPATAWLDKLVDLGGDSARTKLTDSHIQLLCMAQADYEDAEEPYEAFAADLQKQLIDSARWLNKQPTEPFQSLQKQGLVTDVFVGAWIDLDQFDLDLPPEFLNACGKLGLKISIVTND